MSTLWALSLYCALRSPAAPSDSVIDVACHTGGIGLPRPTLSAPGGTIATTVEEGPFSYTATLEVLSGR